VDFGRSGAAAVDPLGEDRERRAFITRMQSIARAVAFDPSAWKPSLASEIESIFDGRAATWWMHRSPEYLRSLEEALDVAGVLGGSCVDVGSGISLHGATLRRRFDHVVAIDFSAEMLRLADRTGTRLVRADASALPVSDGSVDVLVCVNMFLFPREYARALQRNGTIIFVSTSGNRTPIYLSPKDVRDALIRWGDAGFATVSGTCRDACWTVARRAEE
jgi:predicted TPR repeat methyltransferase